MSTPDWGIGQYERTAAQLAPAAVVVVDAAGDVAGRTLVDVGCGTGNAALLAAERGAAAVGVDPAARLLEVARSRAAADALDARFVAGEAAALPLPDASADVVVSVFGVIFAPDPAAAAAELTRVAGPGGRILLSAWIPGGAIGEVAALGRRAVAAVLDLPPGPAPFAWHDRAALEGLFGREVAIAEHELRFTAESPQAYLEAEVDQHPLWLATGAVLTGAGRTEAVLEEALAILVAGNEDPGAFAVTSSYVVATVS